MLLSTRVQGTNSNFAAQVMQSVTRERIAGCVPDHKRVISNYALYMFRRLVRLHLCAQYRTTEQRVYPGSSAGLAVPRLFNYHLIPGAGHAIERHDSICSRCNYIGGVRNCRDFVISIPSAAV